MWLKEKNNLHLSQKIDQRSVDFLNQNQPRWSWGQSSSRAKFRKSHPYDQDDSIAGCLYSLRQMSLIISETVGPPKHWRDPRNHLEYHHYTEVFSLWLGSVYCHKKGSQAKTFPRRELVIRRPKLTPLK